MKTINLLALALATLVTTSVLSQTVPTPPPDQLPIGSLDQIQSFAINRIRFAGANVGADGTVNSGQGSYWFGEYRPGTNGVILADAVQLVETQRLSLFVLYTNKMVSSWVGLYDEFGYNLFDGYGWSPSSNGTVKIPVKLRISDKIWIPFNGVHWVYAVERDSNGNPIRFYSDNEFGVREGSGFMVATSFAGKNGEIVVTTEDGVQHAYALRGGRQILPTSLRIEQKIHLLGFRSIVNTNTVVVIVSGDEIRERRNPLVQFVTTTNRTVFLGAAAVFDNNNGTQTTEMAEAVSIWHMSDPLHSMQYRMGTNRSLVLDFQSGNYGMRYYWASRWDAEPVPLTPVPSQ
jgi:hypothetical protein